MIDGLPLVAAAAEGGTHGVAALLPALIAIFVATKLLGEIAQRLGQPAVLGELIAGIVLGGSVLGIVDPADPIIASMAEIGVIVLLFTIGLETELAALVRVGNAATTVAIAGVVLPLTIGYFASRALGLDQIPALVCGAALCATSVGISARVLSDLGWLRTSEGRVVLGAAVIDDVIGLVILAVVAALVSGTALTVAAVARIAGIAVAFVAVAVIAGSLVVRPLFAGVERIRAAGALGVFGLSFAFLFAWLANLSGSAMIVGAFAAGLVLYRIPQRQDIEKATTTLGHFFVPIFFAAVGASVDLRALTDSRSLILGVVLIAVGIAGKVAAGYAPWWFTGRKLLVGIAMVPRGEVGLIFAQMGLSSKAIDAGEFGAIMLMVLATTFVTPPALARLARGRAHYGAGVAEQPGDGGIDDLVAGASERARKSSEVRPPNGS
ncbi:MAG TPA: cation:proton antiporter [Gemmatimonadaceae bacterium]|nr:cation:proton antiporter [Gemmatimonadaceae bacterium]